jgi:hypothetical protein
MITAATRWLLNYLLILEKGEAINLLTSNLILYATCAQLIQTKSDHQHKWPAIQLLWRKIKVNDTRVLLKTLQHICGLLDSLRGTNVGWVKILVQTEALELA